MNRIYYRGELASVPTWGLVGPDGKVRCRSVDRRKVEKVRASDEVLTYIPAARQQGASIGRRIRVVAQVERIERFFWRGKWRR